MRKAGSALRWFALGMLCCALSARAQSTGKESNQNTPTLSVAELSQKADKGDTQAMFELGGHYEAGEGVPRDYAKAAGWWHKAADLGNADAQFALGALYDSGNGVPQSYGKAAILYRKSAEQDNTYAQVALAAMYYDGVGVNEDHKQAVFWYQKAADKGDPEAQFYLGLSYASGQGVSKDPNQAALWYRKAADQSYASAQFSLGLSYSTGEGVPQDYSEAYFWFDLACAGHFDTAEQTNDAKKARDATAAILTKTDLSKQQDRARIWFESHPQDAQPPIETETQTETKPEAPSGAVVICDESNGCAHMLKNGNYFKVLSANGLEIKVGGWDNGPRYTLVGISLTNNTVASIDLIPADFVVAVDQPKHKNLRNISPLDAAKKEVGESSSQSVLKMGLRANTVAPGESVSGFVYFEADKKATVFRLRVPVAGTLYEFPFDHNR